MNKLHFAYECLKAYKPKLRYINNSIKRLEIIQTQAMSSNDEKLANECWLVKEQLKFKKNYIQTFNQIKSERYYDAWCAFEQLEISYNFIEKNSSPDELTAHGINKIIEVVKQWQSLFPYKLFASPGFTVNYYTCSICDKKIRLRSRCAHEKGKLYNGKICLHVAHGMSFLEVSIVKNPVQKYSVLNPDGHDYGMLKYIVDRLKTPFSNWDITQTIKRVPRKKIKHLKEDDYCPCESENYFKDCCWDKEYLTVPHTLIGFDEEPPSHLQHDLFTY